MISLVFDHTDTDGFGNKIHYFNVSLESAFAIHQAATNFITLKNRSLVIYDVIAGSYYSLASWGTSPTDAIRIQNAQGWEDGANVTVNVIDIYPDIYIPDGPTYNDPANRPRYTGINPGTSDDVASREALYSGVRLNNTIRQGKYADNGGPFLGLLPSFLTPDPEDFHNVDQFATDPLLVGNPQISGDPRRSAGKCFSFFRNDNDGSSTVKNGANGYILNLDNANREFRFYNVCMPSGHYDVGNETVPAIRVIHDPTIP
jgi:hypothetical protein